MIVVGVDPGTVRCGWAILEVSDRRRPARHIASGVIKLLQRDPVEARIVVLTLALKRAIRSAVLPGDVDVLAVESGFVAPAHGAMSAVKLGMARGAAIAALGRVSTRIVPVAPTQAKNAVGCGGRGDKDAVARAVSAILGEGVPAGDVADACAIAIAGAMLSRATRTRGFE